MHYDALTLPSWLAHFYRQAVEERNHAMMLVQYLLDADEEVVVPGVEAPQTGSRDIVEPVRLALEQEKRVTAQISALVQLAREENDLVAEQFLHWFLQEQREEVASMSSFSRCRALARERDADRGLPRSRDGRRRSVEAGAPRPPAARSDFSRLGRGRESLSRTCSATASSSTGAPVTSLSSSSAVGCWPSAHSSFRSEPASRRLNQSLPNSSRRKVESCASNAQERR